MEKKIQQSEKDGKLNKDKQSKKFLTMILEGKLKNPPPSIMEKISTEMGLDILPRVNE